MEKGGKQGAPETQGEPQKDGRFRQYTGLMGVLPKVLGAGLCLFILLYVGGVLPELGFYLISYQFNSIFLTGIVVLVFLLVPARKGLPGNKLPWYDILFILMTLSGSVYVFIKAYDLAHFTVAFASNFQVILMALVTLSLMEAIRRTIGWPMVAILVIFILHARFSYLLPEFAFSILEQGWDRLAAVTFLSYMGMFGMITGIGSNIIFPFITFGIFFMAVGGGDFFMKLALGLTGQYRGGPAKAAIVGSALFGTLSGSPTGNVAVTGNVTIPLMKRTGYTATFAGAVEAVASTGGQIMPPVMGSTAFVMAAILAVPYTTIALMAAIPALLYYVALFLQTDMRAAKTGLVGLPRAELPSIRTTLKEGWEFIIPLLFLVFLLFAVRYPPPLVAVYSIVLLIAISMFRKKNRLSFRGSIDSLYESSRSMLYIAPVLGGSGMLLGLMAMTGLGPLFASALVKISGGSAIILFLMAGVASYILGMTGALTLTYILLAALVAPAIAQAGVPLLVSHFFVLYMGLSTFITPPVCQAVFVAASIADTKPYPMGFQAMRLGIVTYLVPFILIYNPALILMGEPLEIILAVGTAIIGVFALSIGVERYLFTNMNWPQTILAVGAGITMMASGWTSDIIGIGLLAIVLLWQWSTRKNRSLMATDKA